MDPEVWI